jgi:hypothetical protein
VAPPATRFKSLKINDFGDFFLGGIAFAETLLERFRYGPLEWLWRSSTGSARQPLWQHAAEQSQDDRYSAPNQFAVRIPTFCCTGRIVPNL